MGFILLLWTYFTSIQHERWRYGEERRHIVSVPVSFVCWGSIRDLEKVKFTDNSWNFSRFLDWGNFFFKNFVFRRNRSICSHIHWDLKIMFIRSMSKLSQQKNNSLVIYCFFVSSITMIDSEYMHCTNVNSSKWFLVNSCYYMSNLHNLQVVGIEMTL